MCTLPRFNTCLLVSPPIIPLCPPCILSLCPYPRPIPFPTLSALSAHVLLPQLLPASRSVCSDVPTDPQPCLSPSACPARFTGRQPCSALLVTCPVLLYRPPALLALLATYPALLYWPPALLCCFAGPPPCSALLPAALLCFTGHQPCSALLATKSALLYWFPALARPYWPRALLYSSGHQSCSALLATSLATCWSAWPRPPPPPPPPFFCLSLFCLGLTLSLPIESHPGRHHRRKKG